jgi:serine/threonine protein kinase
VRWSSPEVLAEKRISKQSDIWSYGINIKFSVTFEGIVLWEILENKVPYNEILSNEEVASRVIKGSLRLSKPTRIEYPSVLYDAMQTCWSSTPKDRPSFEVRKMKK